MSWSAAMCAPGNGLWAVLSRHRRALEEEAQTGEIAYRLFKYAAIASFTDYRVDSFVYSPPTGPEIARALASEPCSLVLDEPSAEMNTSKKSPVVRPAGKDP